MGITSPKNLLDEIFGNRHVIATIDFPNYLQTISAHYPPALNLTVEQLIYKHTLFPVYAPFISEKRRQACIRLMAGATQGAIHLAVGAAASRLKQGNRLRYCPSCLINQLQNFGECYWMRKWQLAGADCCLEHGPLHESEFERYSRHRHQFICLQPDPKIQIQPTVHMVESQRVVRFTDELLALVPLRSPSPLQWSCFYQNLARQAGCTKGKHIRFERITELVLSRWSASWLKDYNLYPENIESCWLKGIFRKHRKTFSYLEHCIVLNTFSPGRQLQDILGEVASLPAPRPKSHGSEQAVVQVPSKQIEVSRSDWETLLHRYGPKQSRKLNGALYTWLYRHDKDWLLTINGIHSRPVTSRKRLVDWAARDREIELNLCALKRQSQHNLDCPRKSKNWYLSTIEYPSTISKNLGKLSRTRYFLEAHSESVELYQCRRIVAAKVKLQTAGYPIVRWRLLRVSGLNIHRLKKHARSFLERILLTHGDFSIKKYTK